MDSSGNGHRLKTIRPMIPHGGILGGFRGSTIQKPGKCGQTAGPIGNKFCTYNAGESRNGHRLNKLVPWDTRGSILTRVGEMFWVLRGSTFHQKSGECDNLQRTQHWTAENHACLIYCLIQIIYTTSNCAFSKQRIKFKSCSTSYTLSPHIPTLTSLSTQHNNVCTSESDNFSKFDYPKE